MNDEWMFIQIGINDRMPSEEPTAFSDPLTWLVFTGSLRRVEAQSGDSFPLYGTTAVTPIHLYTWWEVSFPDLFGMLS